MSIYSSCLLLPIDILNLLGSSTGLWYWDKLGINIARYYYRELQMEDFNEHTVKEQFDDEDNPITDDDDIVVLEGDLSES